MADRETARLEAAAKAMLDARINCTGPGEVGCKAVRGWHSWREHERHVSAAVLSAADDWDRANGYMTIRPSDLAGRIKHAVQHGAFGAWPSRRDAESITQTVLAVLREAAER